MNVNLFLYTSEGKKTAVSTRAHHAYYDERIQINPTDVPVTLAGSKAVLEIVDGVSGTLADLALCARATSAWAGSNDELGGGGVGGPSCSWRWR